MRILIAPDKFKGSLSAAQAADAIEGGWREVMPDSHFDRACLADGGEGTAEVFESWPGAVRKHVECHDALGRKILSGYVWIPDESLAVIEMSEASGLAKIAAEDRNILHATTFGTGELILDALRWKPNTIAIGLGGSATNDGGAGMASALGWVFQDRTGHAVVPTPESLIEIEALVPPPLPIPPKVVALCDVKNPLLGERGCSRGYGPQKGATFENVTLLESHLAHFAGVCERTLGTSFHNTPGAGAAGGTGFGLLTFCRAEIVSGFEWVAEHLRLDERVAACDLVITGEGSIDSQTLEGKGPGALAELARRHGKPCIAFGGRVERKAAKLFTQCLAISDPAMGLAENLSRGAEFLRATSIQVARSLKS